MSIFLALLVPVVLVFLFAVFKASKPVGQWTDAELQCYLDTNGSLRNRLMIDRITNPAKRREYEALDRKYTQVEQEWARRQSSPKKIGNSDVKWLEARRDFVAKAAKALGVSEQEAGRQILVQLKATTMDFAGRTSAFDKRGADDLIEKIVRECFNPENIEAARKKREFAEKFANSQSELMAKGLSKDKALEQAFAVTNAVATEQKKADEQKGAWQNDVNAQFAMGEKALQAGDLDTALEWFSKAADQGHVKAVEKIFEKSFIRPISDERRQALIATMAKAGVTMYQCQLADNFLKNGESSQARQWLEMAVAKNDSRAMFLLGKMLEDGNGFEKDHAAALDLYLKSANHGCGSAQFRLAVCHETGHGVPQDLKKAFMWYSLAMTSGISDAFDKIGDVAKRMSPGQLEQAKAMVVDWKTTKA